MPSFAAPKLRRTSIKKPPVTPDQRFAEFTSELQANFQLRRLDQDVDAVRGRWDFLAYRLENFVAAEPGAKFYVLVLLTFILTLALARMWSAVTTSDGEHSDTHSWWSAFFMTFQMLLTAGYEDSIVKADQRLVFALMIAVGVTLVAILIGLITDSVNAYMEGLSSGTTKVVEKGHTLILGWNEASMRVVCQLAFLRRVFAMQNEVWHRRYFPWRRVVPSTPVAVAPIVVLANTHNKRQMEEMVLHGFAERGISWRHTGVGRDVVVRCGDPCRAHDLVRVAAQDANSILVMMTERDKAERAEAKGKVSNSATIRTVLALRSVIYSKDSAIDAITPELRVVVQLNTGDGCKALNATDFFDPSGKECLFPQDLTRGINTTLFVCASRPGLSQVTANLLDFSGTAIRTRFAYNVAAGPNHEMGWCVGKKMREALVHNEWKNAVLIGSEAAGQADDKCGIMGDPDRVIRADDSLIFVSTSSTPLHDSSPAAAAASSDTPMEIGLPDQKNVFAASTRKSHILLCGWRDEWSSAVERFTGLVRGMAKTLADGSSITCLNVMPFEAMDALLTTTAAKADDSFRKVELEGEDRECGEFGWVLCQEGFHHVTVKHWRGDPVEYEDVAGMFGKMGPSAFHTVICLGSVVGLDLSASSRDSRILSMLLTIRKFTGESQHHVHIVAENQQDQTSSLALAPRSHNVDGVGHEPDFVNTQAIVARSLVMCLAYPQISATLNDLFAPDSGVDIEFIATEALGLTPHGVVQTWGELFQAVAQVFKYRTVAIGYFENNDLHLAPSMARKVTWGPEHRLIVINNSRLQKQRSNSTAV